MGYTVEFDDDDLRCKSKGHAFAAAQVIRENTWIHPYHLTVEPICRSFPEHDDEWFLEVTNSRGDQWDNDQANEVWLALTPQLADGATLEFQGEGFERWRIHWHSGRVFEEFVQDVIWQVEHEILPPQKERTS